MNKEKAQLIKYIVIILLSISLALYISNIINKSDKRYYNLLIDQEKNNRIELESKIKDLSAAQKVAESKAMYWELKASGELKKADEFAKQKKVIKKNYENKIDNVATYSSKQLDSLFSIK